MAIKQLLILMTCHLPGLSPGWCDMRGDECLPMCVPESVCAAVSCLGQLLIGSTMPIDSAQLLIWSLSHTHQHSPHTIRHTHAHSVLMKGRHGYQGDLLLLGVLGAGCHFRAKVNRGQLAYPWTPSIPEWGSFYIPPVQSFKDHHGLLRKTAGQLPVHQVQELGLQSQAQSMQDAMQVSTGNS